jgi:hypothetical protein
MAFETVDGRRSTVDDAEFDGNANEFQDEEAE